MALIRKHFPMKRTIRCVTQKLGWKQAKQRQKLRQGHLHTHKRGRECKGEMRMSSHKVCDNLCLYNNIINKLKLNRSFHFYDFDYINYGALLACNKDNRCCCVWHTVFGVLSMAGVRRTTDQMNKWTNEWTNKHTFCDTRHIKCYKWLKTTALMITRHTLNIDKCLSDILTHR